MSKDEATVGPLVENLFRRESARLTAHFIHRLGRDHVDWAEDIVQETLLKALHSWRFHGVPDNPRAWIWRVANNTMVDRFRRNRPTEELTPHTEPSAAPDPGFQTDAELELLFLCADPLMPTDTSIPLTLKLACGFSVKEIAGALSLKPETVAQRLVRGKRLWQARRPKHDLDADDRHQRTDAVLNVIYLMLNEGYGGYHPDFWQRSELCHEALRIALLLAEHRQTASPQVFALTALCLFQAARLPGRLDSEGEIILLHEQDRALWSTPLTQRGFFWLQRAQSGDQLSPYHLLAGIAACHAGAETYDATDWPGVLSLYDQLLELDPRSPFHVLNRAIALLEVSGAKAALKALEPLQQDPGLKGSYLMPATRAHVLIRLGKPAAARRELIRAIALAPSEIPRRQLHRRLKSL